MDLTTKKFTITLPTLLGILSVISTIIAGYWYFKNTIETTKSDIESANTNYKDLKVEIQILRDQMYEIAIIHNRNVNLENEIHRNFRKRDYGEQSFSSNIDQQKSIITKKSVTTRDTIDITKIKRPSLQSRDKFFQR